MLKACSLRPCSCSRFTVGQFLYIPLSRFTVGQFLITTSTPVSLLGYTPTQGRLSDINVIKLIFRDVRMLPTLIFPDVRTLGLGRLRNTPGINPAHRGNRGGKAKKPATESRCAQGIAKCEELYFSDQNCSGTPFSLSASSHQPPTQGRLNVTLITVLSREYPRAREKYPELIRKRLKPR